MVSAWMIVGLACGALGQDAAGLDGLIRQQNFVAQRASSAHEDLHKNGDGQRLERGQTHVIGELSGPGIIKHMWCTVGSADPFHGRSLVLRFYWDGAAKPSVEAPLGDFFGVGHGALSDFNSAVVGTSSFGRARNCVWRMPFRKSAKVTITNESTEYVTDSFYYYLDWEKHESLPADVVYFHAQYRQEAPAAAGDYVLLETQGRGHYVGTVYSVHQMETGWFGEGDDRFYVDGEATPSLRGTGTEDYFGDAWGFRQFSQPYYGVSLWEGYYPGDRGTAYRWHIHDPVPFKTSLKVSIEHKGSIFTDQMQHLGQFIERSDWISSVAMWYQDPPVSAAGTMPALSKRTAPYRVLTSNDLTARATPPEGLSKSKEGIAYRPMAGDGKLEFDFEIKEKGRYQISAVVFYSLMAGRYQPFVNGKPVGRVLDLLESGRDPVWVNLDLHDLEPGTHTLRFEGRGASPGQRTMAPKLYALEIPAVLLLRLEDMAGYHEALNATLNNKN